MAGIESITDRKLSHSSRIKTGKPNRKQYTSRYVCTGPIISDFNDNCQADFFDYARMADAWAGNLPDVDLNNDGFLDFMDGHSSIRNRLAELQSGACERVLAIK